MKIALITDTHAGVRNDLECLENHQINFWQNEFFPELKKQNIDKIIHLGDFFDKRQSISIRTMHILNDVFLKEFDAWGGSMILILGNHDVLYKNTNDLNSPKNLFGHRADIQIINKPTRILDDKVLMIPWINKTNYQDAMDAIETSSAPYCFGHFEIAGIEMHKGSVAHDGMNKNSFLKFRQVLSGHFHTQSENGNIRYLGSPFEMTWNDYNDKRGWHIFDTETGELEFVEYKESMFFKVIYDMTDNDRNWIPYKPKNCTGKFIKVVVTEKDNHYDFDTWLKKIQSYNPQELLVFDSDVNIDSSVVLSETDSQIESNIEIISRKVNSLNHTEKNKAAIKKIITTLYTEAEV